MLLSYGLRPRLHDSPKKVNSLQESASIPKEGLMKVTCVEGDMAKAGLGLSAEHRELLMSSHISLLFHIAASVSFRDNVL